MLRIFDRFSGFESSLPNKTKEIIPGRFVLREDPGKVLLLNSIRERDAVFIVPDRNCTWKVECDGESWSGSFIVLPSPCEKERKFLETLILKGSWEEWGKYSPLSSNDQNSKDSEKNDDSVDLETTEFEKESEDKLRYLAEVCKKPRAHLLVNVERVPVGRARRLPRNASSFLAGHPEDWERRDFSSVQPRRILSEIRDDQIEIYENKVAARLIDFSLSHFEKRIRRVRKVLNKYESAQDYSNSAKGFYRKEKRTFEIWGGDFNDAKIIENAKELLSKLESLKRRTSAMRDSVLYKAIPRRSRVLPVLKATNIFVNDQNYKKVADLWKSLQSTVEKDDSAEQRQEKLLKQHSGMDFFSMLLVVRALGKDFLDFEPMEGADWKRTMEPGATIRLEHSEHKAKLDLCWSPLGTISLKFEDSMLKIVPLLFDLNTWRDSAQLQQHIIDPMIASLGEKDHLLVLHSDSDDDNSIAGTKLDSIESDPRTRFCEKCSILPVSGWEIQSVERVMRVIRWFMYSQLMKSMSNRVKLDEEVKEILPELSCYREVKVDKHKPELILLRPVKDLREEIEKRLREKENELGELRQQLRDLEGMKPGKRGKEERREIKDLKGDRIPRCERIRDKLKDLIKNMDEIIEKMKILQHCPVCNEMVNEYSFKMDENTRCFSCSCVGCKTIWQTRKCSCGYIFPSLDPGGKLKGESGKKGDFGPGWEFKKFGADILAIPAKNKDGSYGILCPKCGELTNL